MLTLTPLQVVLQSQSLWRQGDPYSLFKKKQYTQRGKENSKHHKVEADRITASHEMIFLPHSDTNNIQVLFVQFVVILAKAMTAGKWHNGTAVYMYTYCVCVCFSF